VAIRQRTPDLAQSEGLRTVKTRAPTRVAVPTSLVVIFDRPRRRKAAASSGRMTATIDACDGAREAMHGGHTPDSRRAHRFGSLRGCACARSEAVPERSHLSDLHGAGRRQVMQGRETGATAGAAPSGGAAGYLAAERCCVVATSAAATPGLSPRPACHPLAVDWRVGPL
jgi:hypothetical protein